MDDRFLTTTELQKRMARDEDIRKQKRRQQLLKLFGACEFCGEPRTTEFGIKDGEVDRSTMRLICTDRRCESHNSGEG